MNAAWHRYAGGVGVGQHWLSGRPEHREDGRACPSLRDPGDREPVTFVERDVPRVRRLEVRGQVVLIDEPQAVPHEVAANALTLARSFDAEPRQIPVRECR